MEKLFHVRNDLLEVARVGDEVRTLWAAQGLPEDLEMPVTLALEEALSNVIRHGCTPGEEYDIQVRFTVDDRAVEIEISDNARPFDPLSLPPPVLDVPIEQRKVGGLGVFLVRQLMDEVAYEFRDGRNHLRFRKSLAGTAPA